MRHSKFIVVLVFLAAGALSQAQVEDCSNSAKPLYKEIQIYKETEKVSPTKGFIGARLQFDLSLFKDSNLTLKEKVHSIETGFAKCNVRISEEEQTQLDLVIEASKAEVSQSN